VTEKGSLARIPSPRKRTAAAILLAVAVFFMFAYLGEPGRGRAAAISAGVLTMAVGASWDLKQEVWYWATVALLAVCHVPVILLVPWTDKSYPGLELLPAAMLDFVIIIAAIRLVEKAVRARGD
jgi:hypothetical protein